jgi:hypothetical protein
MNPDMNTEQKIITIAEFEGWKRVGKNKKWLCPSGGWHYVQTLPPYLTSRDAICGAVARLDDEQKRVFANTLYDLHLGCDHDHEGYHPREIRISSLDLTAMFLATPAQLADALLLTLGHEI